MRLAAFSSPWSPRQIQSKHEWWKGVALNVWQSEGTSWLPETESWAAMKLGFLSSV